ncbi:MAG: hypothetical protein K1000chlam2_01630 [Chlamydiae bacterium]|nr:hypothetical protein [Chlamydiota bacterium]
MEQELKMTVQEADKYALMKQIGSKKTSIKEASQIMGISYRQARRLWQRYQREGPTGLISKRRGKPSNNQIASDMKEKVLSLIKSKYADYGPTLVREKLHEKHSLILAKETIRQIMIQGGVWKAKKKKNQKVYARRTRRSCLGELVQIDGSYHDWFEDRGEKCCLLVFVDDATSQIMAMRFCRTETTDDYFATLREYLLRCGRPKAFYSDKHSIFRVNMKGCQGKTTFHRALKELDIELICAHSPQAKGRVERANGVLQDRLIKELREENISSQEGGNAYLEKYRKKYNKKFGKEPASPQNAHRKLLPSHKLDEILLEKSKRVIAKDLSFSYGNKIYQIDSPYRNRLPGKHVDIYEKSGKIKYVGVAGKRVEYKKWKEKIIESPKTVDTKELESMWITRKRKPRKHHPWR